VGGHTGGLLEGKEGRLAGLQELEPPVGYMRRRVARESAVRSRWQVGFGKRRLE
ncbi:hypothetical protein GOP47_0030685, partial [Adiantum capillus-veneris]